MVLLHNQPKLSGRWVLYLRISTLSVLLDTPRRWFMPILYCLLREGQKQASNFCMVLAASSAAIIVTWKSGNFSKTATVYIGIHICVYVYIYIYICLYQSERLTFLSSTISAHGFRRWCLAPKPNKNRASSASERPKPFGGFLSPGGSRRSMHFNATTGGSLKPNKRKTNLPLTSVDHGCLHDLTHFHCDTGCRFRCPKQLRNVSIYLYIYHEYSSNYG